MFDGAMATELEALGHKLNTPLWSAHCMTTSSGRRDISAVHLSYLHAGADIISSATYQISVGGLTNVCRLSASAAAETMRECVQLAVRARDVWWSDVRHHHGRVKPLVAASLGSYGACLAGGEEYTGDFHGADEQTIAAFQRERIQSVMQVDGVDCLLMETLPAVSELRLLIPIIVDVCAHKPVIFSFACRDEHTIADGTPLVNAVSEVVIAMNKYWSPVQSTADDDYADVTSALNVIAIGVNCVSPKFVPSLVTDAHTALAAFVNKYQPQSNNADLIAFIPPLIPTMSVPLILAYPNSGSEWSASRGEWVDDCELSGEESDESADWQSAVISWYQHGVRIIGGCCRTTPLHIKLAREVLTTRRENADAQVAADDDVLL